MERLLLNANRNGYAPDQCGRTMTVGGLVAFLEDFEPETPVYLCHDGGYTYGAIREEDIEGVEE